MYEPTLDQYATSNDNAILRRDDDGILEVRLHTDGGHLVWGEKPHAELGYLFASIAADRANRVVIITGTGDSYIGDYDGTVGGVMTAERWDHSMYNGRRLMERFLDIEVPVIAAVNGPTLMHPELALLADLVLASDNAVFADSHLMAGTVPGDGGHVIWPLLIGVNRARHMLLTNRRLSAAEALELGIIAEVLPPDQLLERAWEHARALVKVPYLSLRYARELMIKPIRKLVLESLDHGLALEGLASGYYWPAQHDEDWEEIKLPGRDV
jgi:enoyl-CoA hydratase/carnithine racemase